MAKLAALQLFEGEGIVTSEYVTRTGLIFGKNGRLVLTNKRLLFVNRRGSKTFASYHLSEVIFVERGRSVCGIHVITILPLLLLLFGKNAIKIILRDQTTQRFITFNKDRLIKLIETERDNAKKAEG